MAGKFVTKVVRVQLVLDDRFERGGNLLLRELAPVDALEERVGLELGRVRGATTQSPPGVLDQQLPDEVFRLAGKMLRNDRLGVGDLFGNLRLRGRFLRAERRTAGEQFEREHSHGPPVDGRVVSVLVRLDNLRRHVLDRAAKAVRPFVLKHQLAGQPKVGQHDVAVRVDQDVLQLDVPVDDAQLQKRKTKSADSDPPHSETTTNLVQLLERHDDLGDVDPDLVLGKVLLVVQMRKQFAPAHVVQDDVQLGVRLEGVVHRHQERRALDRLEDL